MTRAAACVWFTTLVASATPMPAQPVWSEFAPPDAGFAVQLPGTPEKLQPGSTSPTAVAPC
jgi:hypothetical protein